MTDPAEHSARLRSFAEAYTAAWCSRDAARVASFYAEGRIAQRQRRGPGRWREAITAVAQGFMTDFTDLRVFTR